MADTLMPATELPAAETEAAAGADAAADAAAVAAAAAVAPAEEEEDDVQPIEKLQTLGVNAGDIKKAKEAGHHTVTSLLMTTKRHLADIKGLSEAKIDKLLDAARQLATGFTWTTARAVESARARDVLRISTGAAAVDAILAGGVETKCVTEVYGEYRTGKTQLCHTLCVTCQLPPASGGAAGKVAVIDTEGAFRPERVRAVAARYGLDGDAVLDNVLAARAHTFEQMEDLLVGLAARMADEPYRLLIVDSLTANLRVDYVGRGELAERQVKLALFMSKLKKLADEFNVAVFITNQVMSDPSGGLTFVADPKKAVGGHVLAHASTVRLSVRKGKAEQRLLKVVQAPALAEAEASYAIGPDGVVDYKD